MQHRPLLRYRSSLALLLAAVCNTALAADLTPPAARISDQAINADHETYRALQGRIRALNERGIAAQPAGPKVSDYHLSKAQCWLDVSFHEYTRNDRSAFPQLALEQTRALIELMERNAAPLPMDTPLINGADRLRPDLWEAAAALKQHRGFACAAQATACGEVELVHAGNEHKQFGWRHAKPYVQIAEDHIGRAQQAAERCIPPAPPPAPAPASMPEPLPAPLPFTSERHVNVLFAFDRSDAASIIPNTRLALDVLIRDLTTGSLSSSGVRLAGYADRLGNPAAVDHNLRLSERRAQTVRDLMVKAGVHPDRITLEGRGDITQVEPCKGEFASKAVLRDCLQVNRRVEVKVVPNVR